jgi:hypothetical protein
MKTEKRLAAILGVTEDGKHISASLSSPYFCFVGETEAQVIEKTAAAIKFYSQARSEQPIVVPRPASTITRLVRQREFSYDDDEGLSAVAM